MRSGKANTFSGRYDFGLLLKSRKMLLIAGHQVVCSGDIGNFHEHIVGKVACDLKLPYQNDGTTRILNELE